MEHLVDLDELVEVLRPAIEAWRRRAVVASPTWRDETATWPQPITPDRSAIRIPESLGLSLQKPDGIDSMSVTVWTGGWADVDFLLDDTLYVASPWFTDVDGAAAVVVDLVDDFLGRARAEGRSPRGATAV